MRTTRWLITAAVAVTTLSMVACCKKKTEEEADGGASSADSASTPATEAAGEINPDWKTKCPQAERPSGGLRTIPKDVSIHDEPDESSKHEFSIKGGTKVNLLGIKQNWVCIDYPCKPGVLCPGWVPDREIQGKIPVLDAGVTTTVDAAVAPVDAGTRIDAATAATDAGDSGRWISIRTDAGRTTTTTTTTGAAGAAGGTTGARPTPPGGRPAARPPR